jgi:hypothetical protein
VAKGTATLPLFSSLNLNLGLKKTLLPLAMLSPYFIFLPIFVISLWQSSRNDNPSRIYMSLLITVFEILFRTKLEDEIKKHNEEKKK